jgi:hypothetical protein
MQLFRTGTSLFCAHPAKVHLFYSEAAKLVVCAGINCTFAFAPPSYAPEPSNSCTFAFEPPDSAAELHNKCTFAFESGGQPLSPKWTPLISLQLLNRVKPQVLPIDRAHGELYNEGMTQYNGSG